MDHYCVYFDHNYAGIGLAMLRSLRASGATGPVWVLCLSEHAEENVAALDLPAVEIVPLATLEAHFPHLATAKGDRSMMEYYFTLTPFICRYVFDTAPDAQRVAYLDSDLFFFGPVATMWDAMGEAPVAIVPHNFNPRAQHLRKYGTYNVGWVSFARSEQGLRCLDYWAASCRQWCRDVPDGDRFADQGYLDRFVHQAPDTAIVTAKGCGLGPWNVARYTIRWSGDHVIVDEAPLIFFHFTGFKKGFGGRWYHSHRIYRATTGRVVRDHIYRPYLRALLAAQATVASVKSPSPPSNLIRNRGGGIPLKKRVYKIVENGFRIADLLTGQSIAEPRAWSDQAISRADS
ncbi:MAG: hypothetical protein V4459_09320 [Pseudomonadota bacterium]